MLVRSQTLSELFYTVDTYSTFSPDYLDDNWYEESEFDNKGFMKDLAELHCDVINECLPAGGVKSVKLIDTSSPREYNFQTDQAYLEIDLDRDELFKYLSKNEQEFETFLRDNFTSRDGFWSFTPNNLRDFCSAVEGTSDEYRDKRDSCLTILAGWYLTRECMTEEEYIEQMWNGVSEIIWDHFEQFTEETWKEYRDYEDEFERLQNQLSFVGIPPGIKYLMDIEEWYKNVKEKADV